ncbi:hypothetical protein [Arthrobacter sp. 9AX]|uniref:hypothetical protein n=1 Tax=Arthrobacter sp. 9AX TaxID=2653131 RepID=UPI001F25EF7E|nr:hypothetical protein [Arthrobacter sp. 9AX]
MAHINTDRTTAAAAACAPVACASPAEGELQGVGQACGEHTAVKPAGPRELLGAAVDKGKALLRVYFHSRKVRAAANALAQALADSREASSWPGDRLPVGEEMSAQVEKLTRRLKLETDAHNRLEALFRSVELGRSAAAV